MLGNILCIIGLHKERIWADMKDKSGTIHRCVRCGKKRFISFRGDGIGKWRDSLPEIQYKDIRIYK